MVKYLLLIASVLLFAFGVIFLFGISSDSSLGDFLAAPFCQDEIVMQRNYRSDTYFCRGEDGDQDITLPIVLTGIGTIGGGVVLFLAGIFWNSFAALRREGRILREGTPATARILQINATNIRINGMPLYDILLQVQPDFQAPYQANIRMQINVFQAQFITLGAEIPVRIDRANPQHVALDLQTAAQNAAVPAAQPSSNPLPARLQQLEESLRAGLITQQEYDRMRQRILEEI
jgi:hypothetical protein